MGGPMPYLRAIGRNALLGGYGHSGGSGLHWGDERDGYASNIAGDLRRMERDVLDPGPTGLLGKIADGAGVDTDTAQAVLVAFFTCDSLYHPKKPEGVWPPVVPIE